MTEATLTTYAFELTIKMGQDQIDMDQNIDMSEPNWILSVIEDNLLFNESIDNFEIESIEQTESSAEYKVSFQITAEDYPKGIENAITESLSFNEQLTSFENTFEFPAE